VTDTAPHEPAAAPVSTRHKWGERFTRLENTPSGCVEDEIICARCGMTRFTIYALYGYPWHAWMPKGGDRMQFDMTPPCLPDEARG
jgi:hypothetical protein